MSHSISLEPTLAKADQAAVITLAEETSTSVDTVKALYEEQVADLAAQASVKQFVGVIATKRVKEHLRRLHQHAH